MSAPSTPLTCPDISPLLAEGYGAEDIALRLSVPAEQVRFAIRAARGKGLLDGVYERGGETKRGRGNEAR